MTDEESRFDGIDELPPIDRMASRAGQVLSTPEVKPPTSPTPPTAPPTSPSKTDEASN